MADLPDDVRRVFVEVLGRPLTREQEAHLASLSPEDQMGLYNRICAAKEDT